MGILSKENCHAIVHKSNFRCLGLNYCERIAPLNGFGKSGENRNDGCKSNLEVLS